MSLLGSTRMATHGLMSKPQGPSSVPGVATGAGDMARGQHRRGLVPSLKRYSVPVFGVLAVQLGGVPLKGFLERV